MDPRTERVYVQFDRHVRALGLDTEQTIELISCLCEALAKLGVVVTRDEPIHH